MASVSVLSSSGSTGCEDAGADGGAFGWAGVGVDAFALPAPGGAGGGRRLLVSMRWSLRDLLRVVSVSVLLSMMMACCFGVPAFGRSLRERSLSEVGNAGGFAFGGGDIGFAGGPGFRGGRDLLERLLSVSVSVRWCFSGVVGLSSSMSMSWPSESSSSMR